jgi:outer membrane biosynthesis protein TonB
VKARWEAGKAHAVSLKVQVDSEGVAQRVNVLRGVHGPWGFDESATHAALASTYAPATRGGIPVGGSLEFTVTFQAQDARR